MNPLLIVNPASADEQIFELKQGANTVGRTRDNDVSLANKSLSRAHARIDVTASGVVLVDLGDLSYQEAADVLEIPVGTVMSRLHRGRRVLKKALADHTDAEAA